MRDEVAMPPIKELSISFDSKTKDITSFQAGERGCTSLRYTYRDSVLIIQQETIDGVQEDHYPVDTIARVKVLS